jgi:hypothetical protein
MGSGKYKPTVISNSRLVPRNLTVLFNFPIGYGSGVVQAALCGSRRRRRRVPTAAASTAAALAAATAAAVEILAAKTFPLRSFPPSHTTPSTGCSPWTTFTST